MTDDVYSSSDSNFSIGSMKSLVKTQTDKRVSKDAANEMGVLTEEYAEKVSKEAIKVAEERGRKTVRDKDIRTAIKNLE